MVLSEMSVMSLMVSDECFSVKNVKYVNINGCGVVSLTTVLMFDDCFI